MATDESNPSPGRKLSQRLPLQRRGRGGRRFRPSGWRPKVSAQPIAPTTTVDEQMTAAPSAEEIIREQTAPQPAPEKSQELRPAPPCSTGRGQPPSAQHTPIQKAIREVEQIIRELKQVLAQMEDVQENLEIAETQKAGDGKEIETLRRTLRQLQNQQETSREGRR